MINTTTLEKTKNLPLLPTYTIPPTGWCPVCASKDDEGMWCKSCGECHVCDLTATTLAKVGIIPEGGAIPDTLYGVWAAWKVGSGEGDVITPIAPTTKAKPTLRYRSQKANGLDAIYNYGGIIGAYTLLIQGLIQSADQLATITFPARGYFARPCPVRPRHGFVDSRVVRSAKALTELWNEVIAADPEGELMLTPAYSSGAVTMNAIWTPNLFTIGKGHDGATAGHDVVSFPLVRTPQSPIPSAVLEHSGLGPTDIPYVELIIAGGDLYATQLRAGPALDSVSPDWIPTETTVTRILRPNGEDLLAWEAVCAGVTPGDGTVVWHPGGSMLDHYAIHARTNQIPLITTFQPREGDVLSVVGSASVADPKAVLNGIIAGSKLDLRENRAGAVALMLYGFHHSAAMTGQYGFWIGVSAAIMARLGTTAAIGEARHALVEGQHPPKPNREVLYSRCINWPLHRQRRKIAQTFNVHRYGNFSGSMGGLPWAQCCRATIDLFDAIRAVTITTSDASVRALLGALNIAINQAHHNGWWMNKFAPKDYFDQIQRGSTIAPLRHAMAPMLTTATTTITDADHDAFVARVMLWEDGVPNPPTIKSTSVVYVPGASAAEIKINTRAMKNRNKTFNIPITTIADRMMSMFQGTMYVDTAGGSYRLILRKSPKATPVVLWEDEKITPQGTSTY